MKKSNKPIYAIKFRNFCFNNDLQARDIAKLLNVKVSTIYKYWSGNVLVPDESKKILEQKIGLDIYDTFYNEEL